MSSAIAVTNLTKRYGTTTAVDQVSLAVDAGEIYGFLGLNGAGKTTMIRMLLGMIRPSEGTVRLLDRAVRADEQELWRRVGYMVESPYAYPELTVRENLELFRRLRGVDDRQAVDQIIDQLALAPYADRRARTLSLGNGQRLGLAKALIHRPELLLLDEPSNGLDPAGVVEIRTLLHDLAQRQGMTIFMSSHILSEVARLATRIGIIHNGQLVEEVDASEVLQRQARRLIVDVRDRPAAYEVLRAAGFAVHISQEGWLELSDEQAVMHPEDIARLLVAKDVPPVRLDVRQDDLETHFLKVVQAEGANA